MHCFKNAYGRVVWNFFLSWRGVFIEVLTISWCLPSIQAEHLTSCYWGGNSNATERHDPSLPYLEQYRIDFEQFKGMFALLFPWACGTHSDILAARLFRLLDENGDLLINFREFVSGLSKEDPQRFQTNMTNQFDSVQLILSYLRQWFPLEFRLGLVGESVLARQHMNRSRYH